MLFKKPPLPPLPELLRRLKRAGEKLPKDLRKDLLAYGDELKKPLLEMTLDEELLWAESYQPEVWVVMHALTLFEELRADDVAEALVNLLDVEEADLLRDRLRDFYTRIGPAAIPVLKRYVDDSSRNPYGRSAACDAMAAMAEDHPQMRADVVDYLTERLDQGADQSEQAETFRAFVVISLLDMKAREALPAIERAFVEDIIDDTVVGMDSLADQFGEAALSPEGKALAERDCAGGDSLHLRCRQCGTERRYPVRHVLVDLVATEKKAELAERVFIREDIKCRKCGALNGLEPSGMGTLDLMGSLLRDVLGEGPKSSAVRHVRPTVRGEEMAATDGLRLYEGFLKQRPDDAECRLGYANLLHTAWRCDEALEHYQRAIELASESPTVRAHALMRMGWLHGERGQVEDARRALEAVLSLPDRQRIDAGLERGIEGQVRSLLDRLERDGMIDHDLLVSAEEEDGESIPFPLAEPRDDDLSEVVRPTPPLRGPDRSTPSTASRKIARNAPCPCGSRRKFKKCCGKS